MKPTNSKTGYFQRFQTFALNRMCPPSVREKDSLLNWRVRILFAFLLTGLLLGLITFIPVTAMVIKEERWILGILDGFAWIIAFSMLLSPRLRYETRAAILLIIAYGLGLYIIVSVGPLSGGPAWLFTFAVLAAILMGLKAAIIALMVNIITLTTIGWLISTGRFGQAFPFFLSLEGMVVAGVNFIFLNAVAAIAITVLLKGLVATHRKETELTGSLEIERSHLIEVKKKLEREIEERTQAQDELRESEKRYRELVENINDVIYTTDENGNITYISPSIEAGASGYIQSDLIGRNFAEFVYHEDLPRIAKQLQKVISGQLEPSEYRIIGKSGEVLWVRSSSRPIYRNNRYAGLRGVIVDITQAKNLQSQLQHSQKMESIAALAGGIAHLFNNNLTSIVGYTSLLEMDFQDDERVKQYIKPMRESAHRMAHLTSQLLAYAREGKYQSEVISLNDLVRDTLPLIRHTLSLDVHLETSLPNGILGVDADWSQMQMVLSAIISNSNDAIEGEGHIRVVTRNVEIREEHPELRQGSHVCLSVVDDGKGMDEETRSRIFDPFFTTGMIGRGLGMSAVYGIIVNHGGWISVDSELGKGTRVDIYLPGIQEGTEKEIIEGTIIHP